MLKYYKASYDNLDEPREVTYEEAYRTLLTAWKDNKYTKSMLTIPNRISCAYSQISVVVVDNDGRRWCAQPGLENLMPDEMYEEFEKEFGCV